MENTNTYQLNELDTFENEGFKIVRNGEVFTLTKEEMTMFRYLDKALSGRYCLDSYYDLNASEEDKKIIEEMRNDQSTCYRIEENFLYCVFEENEELEREIIEAYVEKHKL